MSLFDIKAIDVNAISPQETFVIDTNILFFIHSGFYTSSSRNWTQIREYSNFISNLLVRGNKLYITTSALQEFLYGLEKKAYKLYLSANGLSEYTHSPNYFSNKDYRHLPPERFSVKSQLDHALYEVISLYGYIECPILVNDIDEMILTFDKHFYDPMDYFVVTECKRKGLTNFISSDSDFQYDPSINVYYSA